jgi:quinol monooxygenase YgiN
VASGHRAQPAGDLDFPRLKIQHRNSTAVASDKTEAISVGRRHIAGEAASASRGQTTETIMLTLTKGSAPAQGRLALAVKWEAKDGEADAVADVLRRMAGAVKSEAGTLLFWAHRSPSNDREFFLYELFADDGAFAAHQETEHFKALVLGEALPKLAKRERVPFVPLQAQ